MDPSRVLVVGAGAIGTAVAGHYARSGAKVAVVDLEEPRLARVRAHAPSLVASAVVDLRHEDASAKLGEVVTTLGGADVVVFAAGGNWCGDLLEADPEAFLDLLRVSVLGLKRVANAVMTPLAESGGLLAVITGADGRAPDRFLELWGVTSASLHALARCIAVELAERGARLVVLGVHGVPGGGLDEVEYLVGEAVGDEETAKKLLGKKRIAPAPSADEVARTLLSLDKAPLFGATVMLDSGGSTTLA